MKNIYSAPEFKLILLNAQDVLQESKGVDADPFEQQPEGWN